MVKYLLMGTLLCLAFTACGDDQKADKKGGDPECSSNAECLVGQCDLVSSRCIAPANNQSNNGSNNSSNNNTTALCGDGVVDAGELCDGNCPTECPSTDACAPSTLQGTAAECNATCVVSTTTQCLGGDGCCPSACDDSTDSDCTPTCGNLVVDESETCDSAFTGDMQGACPRPQDCVSQDACMQAAYAGSATTCNAVCDFTPVTSCVSDDGCCPTGCDLTNDNDCRFPTGDACGAASDCLGDYCIQTNGWVDGYCSGGCSVDADCGSGGHCNGRACMSTCASNADCRTGYECRDYFTDGTTICAPATTLVDPGSACVADNECAASYFGALCLQPEAGFASGYCIVSCEFDADCPGASHCTPTETGALCVPDCVNDNQCRNGYACFDYLGDPRNTCGPIASGTGAVGDACSVLQDCGGALLGTCIQATDWVDGYCTTQPCTTNAQCPTGAHCGFSGDGSGICLDDCTTQMDCRSGYGCVDIDDDNIIECAPAAIGTGAIGTPCATIAECAGGADGLCIGEASGWRAGYCSLNDCTVDADCGDVAQFHCGFNDGQPGACLKNCLNSADCRADGYACRDLDDDNVNECGPAGTGTGIPGAACEGTWECGGGNLGFCIDWTDGYCIIGDCISDAECGVGGHCGFVNNTTGSGSCIDTCVNDAECRTGYGCFDFDADGVKECLPEGNRSVGKACDGFQDCSGRENAACAPDPDFPGGYCVQDCSTSGVCPANDVCVPLSSGSFCFDGCSSSADCRAGYVCGSPGNGLANVCLP